MKQTHYIYKTVEKFCNGYNPLETALMEEHTTKELHHIIEMDTLFVIIWKY